MSAKGHPAPNRKPAGESLKRCILWDYKRNARVRGLEWALPDEEFLFLLTENCHYCGIVPRHPSRKFVTR